MGSQQSSRGTGVVGTGQYVGRTKWARGYYDFATDAGAIGSINLRGDALPKGALVLSAFVKVDTGVLPVTTSTVALTLESAGDLRTAAVATGDVELNAAGTVLSSVTRASAPLPLTADRQIVATIAAGALTAGRFSVFVEYIEPASVV